MPEKDLEQRVMELERLLRDLQSPNQITPEFQKVLDSYGLSTSSKGATTENKTVNESGSDSYAVMDKPDGFLEVSINGTIYYLPYFG
jgi:hypothetical protein